MIKIGFVVSPGFELMSLTATSVFEFANYESDEPIYDVRIVSEFGEMNSPSSLNSTILG